MPITILFETITDEFNMISPKIFELMICLSPLGYQVTFFEKAKYYVKPRCSYKGFGAISQ